MYDDVRRAYSARGTLLEFLRTSYDAGADLGMWNRKELEKASAYKRFNYSERCWFWEASCVEWRIGPYSSTAPSRASATFLLLCTSRNCTTWCPSRANWPQRLGLRGFCSMAW